MSMGTDKTVNLKLSLEMTDAEAWAFAQFCKRVGWSEFRANAADEDEAYTIRAGLDKVAKAFTEAGYAPR